MEVQEGNLSIRLVHKDAVCFHDTAGTGIVDPQVHGKDPGVPDLFFFQFYFLLEGKVQVPFFSPLP